VGSATEPELKQKKQMFEDSLNSTKAALESGVVPGGGVALLRAAIALKLQLEGDEALGARIVTQACETPLKQIANNAGSDGLVVLSEVRQAKPYFGFNAMSGKVEDLVASGVVDPSKVVISSLTFAASVAGIVLISEALIGEAPEEEEKQ
jgi:chaperonin GroEL